VYSVSLPQVHANRRKLRVASRHAEGRGGRRARSMIANRLWSSSADRSEKRRGVVGRAADVLRIPCYSAAVEQMNMIYRREP